MLFEVVGLPELWLGEVRGEWCCLKWKRRGIKKVLVVNNEFDRIGDVCGSFECE